MVLGIPILGIVGAVIVGFVFWSLIDPQRFKAAGEALGPFGVGFGQILTAPLQPIGALGTELTELSGGLADVLNTVVKPFIDSIQSFFNLFGGIAGITPPSVSITEEELIRKYMPLTPPAPPPGTPIVKDIEKGECEGLMGEAYLQCMARRLGLADWAKSQPFLESVLLSCGCKES